VAPLCSRQHAVIRPTGEQMALTQHAAQCSCNTTSYTAGYDFVSWAAILIVRKLGQGYRPGR